MKSLLMFVNALLFGASLWAAEWASTAGSIDVARDAKNIALRKNVTEIGGEWIGGGATAFEKDFTVGEGVASAKLTITGLGYYEAQLDGLKIGDRVLDPSPTDYNRRVLYSTYPIRLTPGAHTLRILLGHGWYDMRTHATWHFDESSWRDRPKTIAKLTVTYADGHQQVVRTDGSWNVVDGPIIYDCIREGEVVDGRKRWRRTGEMATVVKPPAGKLEESRIPASKVVARFAPQRIYNDSKGRTIAVFPKTIAGWVRLTLHGQQPGDVVSIRYDENLDVNGDAAKSSAGNWKAAQTAGTRKFDCFFVKSGAGADIPGPKTMQTDRYVANGSDGEVFEPRFVYHGFRYAVIEGLRKPLKADDIRACFVRTDFPESGTFESSSTLFNELVEMARHSYLVNFTNGFPTDCPHREKLGWCNDAWIVGEMGQLYFDNAPAYLKWIQDIADTQRADGLISVVAPTGGKYGYAWGSGPLCGSIIGAMPYEVWRYKGERRAVELAYPTLARYLAHEKTKEVAPWINEDGLGDWNANGPLRVHSPSVPFVVTCLCMRLREIASEFAAILGDRSAAERFRSEAIQTRIALRGRFLGKEGRVDNATQTAQALALMYRLWDTEAERDAMGRRLVDAVEVQGRHFQGGQVGTKYVFRALSEIGRSDLALEMILNPTEPTMVKWTGKNGTLWEDFADGFSKAHVMLADFSAWAMQYVAGLREPLEPGCGKYLIAPIPVKGLDWAKATTKTPKGTFVAGWRREGNVVVYSGEVPANCRARLQLPGAEPREIGSGRWEFRAIGANGAGREFLKPGKIELGVNYWASQNATRMWRDWRPDEIEKDFETLKRNGFTLLRVFPTWSDFQPIVEVHKNCAGWDKPGETVMTLDELPRPNTPAGYAGVDQRMLDRFGEFCDLAEKHGLRLIVAIMTGQMTFRNFIPPALENHNPYSDPYALKWEGRFIECFVNAMKRKPAIVAWESGNESRALAKVESTDQAEFWLRYIHSIIRTCDATRPVISVDGFELTGGTDWVVANNAHLSDYVPHHLYTLWRRESPERFDGIRNFFFPAAGVKGLEDISGKPSFCEEHGARRAEQCGQQRLAHYMRPMLWNLWAADGKAMVWWCAFDQDQCLMPPYNWTGPCLELGIFRRDRREYPATKVMRDFAAFQRSLDFSLPKAKPDMVVFTQDTAVERMTLASLVLAREAGLFPQFADPAEPIPDAKVYFLPCAAGRARLTQRNWLELQERVRAGATLYLSWSETFLSSIDEVCGLELDYREAGTEPLAIDIDIPGADKFTLKVTATKTRRFRSLGAEVLGKDQCGNPFFFRHRLGKGTVYTLGVPLETTLFAQNGGFDGEAYRLWRAMVPHDRLVDAHSQYVNASEHYFDDSHCGVLIVNNGQTSYSGTPAVARGWHCVKFHTDSPADVNWKDGRLRLASGAGILLKFVKDL